MAVSEEIPLIVSWPAGTLAFFNLTKIKRRKSPTSQEYFSQRFMYSEHIIRLLWT